MNEDKVPIGTAMEGGEEEEEVLKPALAPRPRRKQEMANEELTKDADSPGAAPTKSDAAKDSMAERVERVELRKRRE